MAGNISDSPNRIEIMVRFVAAIICAPKYAYDLPAHLPMVSLFVVGSILSAFQHSWMKKHKAYWGAVRKRERERRAQRRARLKAEAQLKAEDNNENKI
ncbi:MAG: hypothetical protein QM645_05565 [Asticcacaulis sp.]